MKGRNGACSPSKGRRPFKGGARLQLVAAHTANASGAPARNRDVLVEAMHAEGFVNYPGEWWHFNYFVRGAVVLDAPIR